LPTTSTPSSACTQTRSPTPLALTPQGHEGRHKMEIPSMLPPLSKPFLHIFFFSRFFPLRAVLQRTHLYCPNVYQCSYDQVSQLSSGPPRSDATLVILLDSPLDAPRHTASTWRAASCGVETSRRKRPSIRAGLGARHPMLSASFDDAWKAQRRRPHLYDGVLSRPGIATGRLHQSQGRAVTSHRQSPSPSLSTAPSGNAPVSRKRQSAMSHLRATATMPMRLKRVPPPPKRSRNHTRRALSG
jgi:hypothetical protein